VRFKSDRGILFSTYAVYWIRQALQRYCSDQSMLIRVPAHVYQECRALRKKFDRILSEAGQYGISQEQAGLELSNPKLAHCWMRFQLASDIRSLSDRKQPEYQLARQLVDSVDDPSESLHRQDATLLTDLFVRLNPRQARVIRGRFGFDGDPKTLAEIALIECVSRERIRQIEFRALQRLRKWCRPLLVNLGLRVADTDEADSDDFDETPELVASESGRSYSDANSS
jgi:RNA polymerase primary sigma factor